MRKNAIKWMALALLAITELSASCYDSPCEEGRWFVGGDYLMWRAREDSLVYGVYQVGTPTGTEQVFNNKALNLDYKWDDGFRVVAGYESSNAEWTAVARYVHFKTQAKNHFNVIDYINSGGEQNNALLYSDNIVGIANTSVFGPFSEVEGKLNRQIDWFDLALSKTFCPTSHFWMNVEIGGRGLWMKNRYTAAGISPSDEIPFRTFNDDVKIRSWAYGLESTFTSGYELDCGLGLNGFFGGAIMYSQYKIHEYILSNVVTSTTTTQDVSIRDTARVATPMLDIGVNLVYRLSYDRYVIGFHVGWEQHVIFNVRQGKRGGNLTVSGVNAGADVSF